MTTASSLIGTITDRNSLVIVRGPFYPRYHPDIEYVRPANLEIRFIPSVSSLAARSLFDNPQLLIDIAECAQADWVKFANQCGRGEVNTGDIIPEANTTFRAFFGPVTLFDELAYRRTEFLNATSHANTPLTKAILQAGFISDHAAIALELTADRLKFGRFPVEVAYLLKEEKLYEPHNMDLLMRLFNHQITHTVTEIKVIDRIISLAQEIYRRRKEAGKPLQYEPKY